MVGPSQDTFVAKLPVVIHGVGLVLENPLRVAVLVRPVLGAQHEVSFSPSVLTCALSIWDWSHVLVCELTWLRELGHLFATTTNTHFALERLRHFENALLRFARHKTTLALDAGLVVEKFLPRCLFLQRVVLDFLYSLLFLDRLDLPLLGLLLIISVCFLDHETLGDSVTCWRQDLFHRPFFLCLAQPHLVELHLYFRGVGKGHLVSLLGLLGNHTIVPQTVLEDRLTLRPWLTLSRMRWAQHADISDFILTLVLEPNEICSTTLDTALVATHGDDLGVVPLLLIKGLASTTNQRRVHRLGA
mmetsp:Transcript_51071/g.136220  ORF Transcript_51071/g.136220 Transcript_51071/m.136220 type:complete len:302 (+) Transcript_51071:84-989(+)